MHRGRYILARISYWALFIVLPMGALFAWFGEPAKNFAIYVVALVVLTVIGERGFRGWKKLWKVEEE